MVAVTNLLGLAGLAAIAVAVGALTGNWWWSALAGGIAAVLLAGVAQYNAAKPVDQALPEVVPRLRARSRSA